MELEEMKKYIDVENGILKIKADKAWDGKGYVTFEAGYNLVDILRIAAAKTDNKIDDMMVEMIAKALEADA